MSFTFAYALPGDADTAAFDYPLDLASNTPVRGMAVKLVSGKLQKAVPADTVILGVLAATNFTGLNLASTVGKVRISKQAVYRVDFIPGTKTSFTNSDIGIAYDMLTGAIAINPDVTTVGQWRVVNFNNALKVLYVVNNKPLFV